MSRHSWIDRSVTVLCGLTLAVPATLAQGAPEVTFPAARPPNHDIVVENRVPAAMRDGVVLHADVYRQKGEGRYPVLISRTPYST